MFVLTILNGKKYGTYLEIGAGDPIYGNNTKLLEDFKWDGLSIDWSNEFLNDFLKLRKNHILNQNALELNYEILFKSYFKDTHTIDYLSLDIDPAENTLSCLYALPLDNYIFNTITFEHDNYQADDNIKMESRELLQKYDYVLVGEDIKFNYKDSFEDWYIHKSILTDELKEKINILFKNSNGNVNKIFFKK